MTGFANEEEAEVHLTHVVPFLVEDELKRVGAVFEKLPNWHPRAIRDGRVITGQNPASSALAAKTLPDFMGVANAACGSRDSRSLRRAGMLGFLF